MTPRHLYSLVSTDQISDDPSGTATVSSGALWIRMNTLPTRNLRRHWTPTGLSVESILSLTFVFMEDIGVFRASTWPPMTTSVYAVLTSSTLIYRSWATTHHLASEEQFPKVCLKFHCIAVGKITGSRSKVFRASKSLLKYPAVKHLLALYWRSNFFSVML